MPQVYFDNNDDNNSYNQSETQVKRNPFQDAASKMSLTAKTFIYLCLGILLTGAVTIGLPYLLPLLGATQIYTYLIIGATIGLLVLSFVINLVVMSSRSKVTPIVMYVLYSLCWGILLSSIALVVDIWTMGYALLVTAAIFGGMGLFGYLTKRSLDGFGNVMLMLMFGAMIISVINIFAANQTIDWIVSYVILAAVIGFVAVDFNRLRRLNELRYNNSNIALLMAINLYTDFVYIFVRLLPLIISARSNN